MPSRHGTQILQKHFLTNYNMLKNKCIRFCLNLENRAHLDKRAFKKINWLPTNERVNQHIYVSAYNTSPSYMSDIFTSCKVMQNTRNSAHRFKIPLRRTNNGQNALSYIGPNLSSDLKLSKNKNAFKHKIKYDFLKTL